MTRLEDLLARALRDLIETRSRSVPYSIVQRSAWRTASTALEEYDQEKSAEHPQMVGPPGTLVGDEEEADTTA